MKNIPTLLFIALFTASGLAAGQLVRTERNISSELADHLAIAAVKACMEKGFAVTATVVDRAGTIRAVLRADGAGPHTIDSSRAKAFTSASSKSTTTALMETAQNTPGAANLVHIPGFLLLGGGVPVKAGDEVIGGIGVGGAPGGFLDEQCAMAALDKFVEVLR